MRVGSTKRDRDQKSPGRDVEDDERNDELPPPKEKSCSSAGRLRSMLIGKQAGVSLRFLGRPLVVRHLINTARLSILLHTDSNVLVRSRVLCDGRLKSQRKRNDRIELTPSTWNKQELSASFLYPSSNAPDRVTTGCIDVGSAVSFGKRRHSAKTSWR